MNSIIYDLNKIITIKSKTVFQRANFKNESQYNNWVFRNVLPQL